MSQPSINLFHEETESSFTVCVVLTSQVSAASENMEILHNIAICLAHHSKAVYVQLGTDGGLVQPVLLFNVFSTKLLAVEVNEELNEDKP